MGVAAGAIFAGIGAAAAGLGTAEIISVIFVNLMLTGLSLALAGVEKRDPRMPIQVTVRSTTEYRRLGFGQRRAYGAFAYVRQSSPNVNEPAKYLWYVVVLHGHQIKEISDVWIGTVRIPSADIDAATGVVSTASLNGKVHIWKYLGTSAQTANADLIAALPGEWTTDHKLSGNAYLVIKMERDDAVFPNGAPDDISALRKGALCYDDREVTHDPADPSTWAYTANPILHSRWVITGGSVVNDVTTRLIRYGLRETDARIDETFTNAAANICEEAVAIPGATTEPRFECNIEVSCGEKRGDILKSILATCAGQAIYVHGKWRLYAGAYDTPTHTIGDDDFRGDIDIDDIIEMQDRYNRVSAVFFDAKKDYVESTSPFRTNATYETADGEPLPKELDLRGVTSVYQCERLCELALQQSRNMRTIQFPGGLDLLKWAPWETASVSNTELVWSSIVYRCLSREVNYVKDGENNILCPVITAKVDTSAAYTDIAAIDYIGSSTVIAGSRDVDAPGSGSGLRSVGQVDGILLRWDASGTPGANYELQESTSSGMSSPTTVYTGPDTQALLSKTVTTTFYYRVRAIRVGQQSAWDPVSGGVAGAASSISGGFRATANPGSVGKVGTTSGLTSGSTTVTPVNGTAPYTYAWTWASGGTSITINSASAATTTFSVTGMAVDETRSGIARCTVTDNASATTTTDIAVSFHRVTIS